jgi:hypothetical protein
MIVMRLFVQEYSLLVTLQQEESTGANAGAPLREAHNSFTVSQSADSPGAAASVGTGVGLVVVLFAWARMSRIRIANNM